MERLFTIILSAIVFSGDKSHFGRSAQMEQRSTDGDFGRLVQDRLFVDKTMMIREFLKCTDGKLIAITRPNGWGKTTNLDMVNRFFQLRTNELGEPVADPRSDQNYRLFVPNTKIAECVPELEHFGRYPTVRLNFSEILGNSFPEVERKLKTATVRLFNRYRYLNGSEALNELEQTDLQSYLDGSFDERLYLPVSLKFLIKALRKYFRRPVLVLIDDYDLPLLHLFRERLSRTAPNSTRMSRRQGGQLLQTVGDFEEFQSTYDFFVCYLETALNENADIFKALLTGQFHVPLETEFVRVDRVSVFTLQDSGFFEYYGLSENEAHRLLGQRSDRPTSLLKKEYGYGFGGRDTYSPSAFRRFVETAQSTGQAEETDDDPVMEHLIRIDRVQRVLIDLLGGKPVYENVTRSVSLGEGLIDYALSYLLHSGRLNTISYGYGGRVLFIPNRVVYGRFQRLLQDWLGRVFNRTTIADDASGLAAHLHAFRPYMFRIGVKRILRDVPDVSANSIGALMHCVKHALENSSAYVTIAANFNSSFGAAKLLSADRITLTRIGDPDADGEKRFGRAIVLYFRYFKRSDRAVVNQRNVHNAIDEARQDDVGRLLLEKFPDIRKILRVFTVCTGRRLHMFWEKKIEGKESTGNVDEESLHSPATSAT